MPVPPEWVPYLALAVSACALLVAGTSLVYSARSFSRAGARVRVKYSFYSQGAEALIEVKIINSGLASVGIGAIHLAYGAMSAVSPIVRLSNESRSSGPALPCRVDGNTTEKWVFNFQEARFRQRTLLDKIDVPSSAKMWTQIIKATGVIMLLPFVGLAVIAAKGWYPGILVVVELGNGVEVFSRPQTRLFQMFLKRRLLEARRKARR